MSDIILETKRTILRTQKSGDIDAFMLHLNIEPVMQFLGGVQERHQVEALFARMAACQAQFGHSFYIVQDKDDGQVLGFCGLKRVNSAGTNLTNNFEIGWRLRREIWGNGIGFETAHAVMQHGFSRLRAPHIVALTIKENLASIALMRKLGMARAAHLDFNDPEMPFGLNNPIIVHEIKAEEFAK
ncbi:hypothetical protein LPB140_11400 [Sphingorhabdus lutea]|uniref:N-acetyltransferase domain-containing protein n=1 Tax=Sphingorhabdus lutea TaxID=1913578 RepID=A0A1L3JDU1_9SPHN|nr:GNAT family N-acetyltransferase [Sphingorhabdus lutea]APG63290.1 hypothetical protein LPB140_11400 [Sphingorhabdus lutea]